MSDAVNAHLEKVSEFIKRNGMSNHGGKRSGAGRPPKVDGLRLTKTFGVRVTDDEKELLEQLNAKEWARVVLLEAARKKAKK